MEIDFLVDLESKGFSEIERAMQIDQTNPSALLQIQTQFVQEV